MTADVLPDPPPHGDRVIIEWPPPREHGMPGWGVSLFDADTGKQIMTALRVTIDPQDVIKAIATVFADEDGNPVYDREPVITEDGTGIRMVNVELTVTGMRIAEATG